MNSIRIFRGKIQDDEGESISDCLPIDKGGNNQEDVVLNEDDELLDKIQSKFNLPECRCNKGMCVNGGKCAPAQSLFKKKVETPIISGVLGKNVPQQ